MLANARVVPTLAVSDIGRARRFYEGKLGFEAEAVVEGTVRYRCGGGTGLAIFERPMQAIDRTVAAFEVEDIEREVRQLRERDVEVEGVITLPSGILRAFFTDPDGNVIGMRQLPAESSPAPSEYAPSRENVEIVRQLYEAVNAQRWGTNRDLYDPDYEVDLRDGGVGVIRGVEASETTLREYWDTFENFQVELREVIQADDEQVVTAVRDGGRPKGSDAEVWNRFFHVWAFRNGKILRLSVHTDRDKALEAAGLSK
jgi:ketosteroid isomerase-like protein/catechol 2,3-dioxygenase-like lactoylglutathione lyase family enzyme